MLLYKVFCPEIFSAMKIFIQLARISVAFHAQLKMIGKFDFIFYIKIIHLFAFCQNAVLFVFTNFYPAEKFHDLLGAIHFQKFLYRHGCLI